MTRKKDVEEEERKGNKIVAKNKTKSNVKSEREEAKGEGKREKRFDAKECKECEKLKERYVEEEGRRGRKKPGTYTLPVELDVPEGAAVLSYSPREVTVTINREVNKE